MITFTAEDAKDRIDEVFSAAVIAPVEITSIDGSILRITSVPPADRPLGERNQHDALEDMRHRIGCEILSRFPLSTVRDRSRNNLLRWRAQGVWSKYYEEWLRIIESDSDVSLISYMIGFDEDCYRLRQSMPYVGMLEQSLVRRIHAGHPSLP